MDNLHLPAQILSLKHHILSGIFTDKRGHFYGQTRRSGDCYSDEYRVLVSICSVVRSSPANGERLTKIRRRLVESRAKAA